jgi:hypothetical protein
MTHLNASGWRTWFSDDLAWDIFTVNSILATVLSTVIALLVSLSETFAKHIGDMEGWLWAVVAVQAFVACLCASRIVTGAARHIAADPIFSRQLQSASLAGQDRRPQVAVSREEIHQHARRPCKGENARDRHDRRQDAPDRRQ